MPSVPSLLKVHQPPRTNAGTKGSTAELQGDILYPNHVTTFQAQILKRGNLGRVSFLPSHCDKVADINSLSNIEFIWAHNSWEGQCSSRGVSQPVTVRKQTDESWSPSLVLPHVQSPPIGMSVATVRVGLVTSVTKSKNCFRDRHRSFFSPS